MSALAYLLVVPALLPLGLTLINLLTWRRGRPDARLREAKISVLVPARNEEACIERCVRAIASSVHPVHEIIVCDDHSSDGTAAIVERLSRELRAVRLIQARSLPPGWVGKPHACSQLAEAASGDVLLFVDADTKLTPTGIARVASLLADADVVTAVPEQRMESWMERLMMPLLIVTYTSWLPLMLIRASRDERFVAANGQVLAIRRAALADIGGFESVAHEIVDDVALCRQAKRAGKRVVFADGRHIAICRMYCGGAEIWAGFSKNIYEGIGGHPLALLAVIALHLAVFVAPWVALVAALAVGSTGLAVAAAGGVFANMLLRAILVVRFGHPVSGIVTHPLAVLVLLAIAVNSMRWSMRGELLWAGRKYAQRDIRRAA